MSRTFEETHPWLTFALDLRRLPHTAWMLLGEAQSKAQHISGIPLLPALQARFHELFLAKGVLATTAIEGNTLSESEVLQHLRGELSLPPSRQYLKQEIENVLEACNRIGPRILQGAPTRLSRDEICEFNALVLRNLPLSNEVEPGILRQHEVGVGRYKGAPPEDLAYLLDRLCGWLNESFDSPPSYDVAFGVLKAIVAHLYLAWIHPFGDGNGRTARLMEFQILLSVGVPSIAAHLLSNHYNQTRTEYYRQLDEAHRRGGDPIRFIEYALQGLVDGLKEQIEIIQRQQVMVHWVNFLHDEFRGMETKTGIRRRKLAIALSYAPEPTPLRKIRHLTPELAEAYADRTDKTVKRDLNALEARELAERRKEGYRARIERILAFLPTVRMGDESS